jgi:hypothetical protein
MYLPAIRDQALALVAAGVNDCEISRRLGVARTTVRDWHAPGYAGRARPICPRCWERGRAMAFPANDYAELLALYLGDGCISRLDRTYSLRISMDANHPSVLAQVRELLSRCFLDNCLTEVSVEGTANVVLCVYSRHMPCLFPQHGPGKKHERSIALEPWQSQVVDRAPWAFLRGCINSDGCCFINRTGSYEYLSYDFYNHSADILDLFAGACERVGVEYRRYERRVRIYRRQSVELLRTNVGIKG